MLNKLALWALYDSRLTPHKKICEELNINEVSLSFVVEEFDLFGSWVASIQEIVLKEIGGLSERYEESSLNNLDYVVFCEEANYVDVVDDKYDDDKMISEDEVTLMDCEDISDSIHNATQPEEIDLKRKSPKELKLIKMVKLLKSNFEKGNQYVKEQIVHSIEAHINSEITSNGKELTRGQRDANWVNLLYYIFLL
ncbi:hypothetical protein EIN_359920 [Entamoeba invadens IP1]|uniref:Uncharacterized protein n=1 Tax=Entamoeba invadens IP1 TaxID=370355 RepID=A0A0A1UDR8_ENTIV|nr:hypothetical protein EIN_359920 [Entamoeba invadens IP1]ELP90899.1 hypothetical protein EIN_359920 [Entamoeba invadens IP1]|eukprot:XP_004257670.1 hypothetical protein EIN_359920 [Entamoeba invadens IP1]